MKPEIINPSVDADDGDLEDSDLELEEVNLKFKTSPRSNMNNQKEKNVQIKVPRKQKIPFCAARSTQPSHNVGLNIQGKWFYGFLLNKHVLRSTTPIENKK